MQKASPEHEMDTREYVEKGRLLAKVSLRDMQMLFDDAVVKWAADPNDRRSAGLVMDIYRESWLRGRVPDERKHQAAMETITRHGVEGLDDLRKSIGQSIPSRGRPRT